MNGEVDSPLNILKKEALLFCFTYYKQCTFFTHALPFNAKIGYCLLTRNFNTIKIIYMHKQCNVYILAIL